MIGELAALGAAISWTISAMLYRKALSETKPISANIIRLTCTGAILLVFVVVFGKFGVLTSLPTDIVVLASVSGIVGLGIGDTLYMMSLKAIGVARAVPITCTYPLFSLLWEVFLIGKPPLPVTLGATTIVLGILLVSRESERNRVEMQRRILLMGVAFALATAVAWSISITMINVAVKETPNLDHALAINIIRVAAIAISLLALSPLIDKGSNFRKTNRKTLATLIAGGIVALGFEWFLLTYSFTEIAGSRAVPISSTTPLFSTLVSIVLLHEEVTAKNALGSIIIVIGIFLIFLF